MHNPQADYNMALFSEQENRFESDGFADDCPDFESDPIIAEIESGPEITELDIALACAFLTDDQREQWRYTLFHFLRETTKYSDNRISRLVGRIVNASATFRDVAARLEPAPAEALRDPWRNTGESYELARWAQALDGDWSKFPAAIFNKRVAGVEAISRLKQKAKFRRYRETHADEVRAYEQGRAPENAERRKQWNAANPGKVLEQKTRARARAYLRPFVVVDSEGAEAPDRAISQWGSNFEDHVSFLWGAGNDRNNIEWLEGSPQDPLTSTRIIEWLLSLPNKFGDANFVAFAFGYDATQILRGLPRHKAFEIARNKTMPKKGKLSRPVKAATLWGQYALRYRKGKKLEIWRLRDPDYPYTIDCKGKKVLDTTDYICIDDIYSFYGKSFVKVIESLKDQELVSETDFRVLSRNKNKRKDFKLPRMFPDYARSEPRVATIKRYTGLELELAALAANQLRDGFEKVELRLKEWTGPGCAAAALLQKERVFEHYPNDIKTSDIPAHQDASHHGFFGGRIELLQQGYTEERLWGGDLANAYPSGMLELPSMKDGMWHHVNCFNEQEQCVALYDHGVIEGGNILNMYQVEWDFPERKREKGRRKGEVSKEEYIPFFPLPYRRNDNAILFPSKGKSWIVRDDLVAALKWIKKFTELGFLKHGNHSLIIEEAWLFHSNETFAKAFETKNFKLLDTPSTSEEMARPFAFVKEYYARRKAIKQEAKYNIAELVIKLTINSLYGKQAQRLGGMPGKPPRCANPYYAACITASTRRRLMEAALLDPFAIVMFATDGIVATRPLFGLPRAYPKTDKRITLGDWEVEDNLRGGIFLQSGVYSFLTAKMVKDENGETKEKFEETTKLRGMDIRNLQVGMPMRKFLLERVLPAWGRPSEMFDQNTWPSVAVRYNRYVTVGQAVATADSFRVAGRWADISRVIRVHNIGVKRGFIPGAEHLYYSSLAADGSVMEAERCHALVPTLPSFNSYYDETRKISKPAYPDWLESAPIEIKTYNNEQEAMTDAMRPDIRANQEARRDNWLDENGDYTGEGLEFVDNLPADPDSDPEIVRSFIAALLKDDEALNVAGNW
jgi:hypothetical protein